MSGKNQHYIPQAVLEAFRIPNARSPQVRVYRREKSFPSAINNVAAEDYFYSRLTTDGSETLDDVLTRHESGPLNDDLHALAAIAAGPVDGALAARIIAHLTGRGDHLRGMFRASSLALASLIETLLGSSSAVAAALGAQDTKPGPRFLSILSEHLAKDTELAALELPSPLLTSLSYTLVRENAKRGFEEMSDSTRHLADHLRSETNTLAQGAHGKSLAKGPVADAWVTVLAALEWRIETVTDPLFILPDFIGLATDEAGESGTIFSVGGEALHTVLVPLSPTRMLIGEAEAKSHDLRRFNARAAPHCLAFFVSAYASDELDRLREIIGTQADAPIREGLAEAAAHFRAQLDAPPERIPLNGGAWRETPWTGFDIHSDLLSGKDLEQFGNRLGAMTGRMRMRFDTDRLSRVIAHSDYAGALASVNPDIKPSQEGWSAAYNIDVVDDDRSHVVMVLHPNTAAMLLSNDDLLFGAGASIFQAQLTRIGADALLWAVFGDREIPGSGPDRLLLPHVVPAWKSFYVALEQCRFEKQLPAFYRDQFLRSLNALPDRLTDARRGYWQTGVIDELSETAIIPVARLMADAASAAAAVESDPGANLTEFCATLESVGLLNWFELFSGDIEMIWLPGFNYPDPEAFHVLARHAERLLATGGLFIWDDGSPFGRIDVPHSFDAEWALTQFEAGTLAASD